MKTKQPNIETVYRNSNGQIISNKEARMTMKQQLMEKNTQIVMH